MNRVKLSDFIFLLGLKPNQWCHASILMRQKIACDKLIVGKI